jgi:hypothetical protein
MTASALSLQAAHQGRGPAHRRQHRQAARVAVALVQPRRSDRRARNRNSNEEIGAKREVRPGERPKRAAGHRASARGGKTRRGPHYLRGVDVRRCDADHRIAGFSTAAKKKAPRRSVGPVGGRSLCAAEPIPAQSAPSLAQVRSPGEQCRPGAVICQAASLVRAAAAEKGRRPPSHLRRRQKNSPSLALAGAREPLRKG